MKLLRALIDANGREVPYGELIRAVWGNSVSSESSESSESAAGTVGTALSKSDKDTLFATISRLRKKIELDRTTPQLILSVQRVGYRCHLSAG
jgi:DNA-binding response OmpR family regulator